MAKEEEEKDYGEPFKFDPDFHGPIRNRSCTDILFLILFIVMLGCWVGIGIYAIGSGDVGRLLAPINSLGNRCGYDSTVIDKPLLVFFDITRCLSPTAIGGCPTPQVCVSSCPTTSRLFQIELLDAGANVEDIKNNLVCRESTDLTNVNSVDMINNLISNGQCAPFILESMNVGNRCIPNFQRIGSFIDQLLSAADIEALTGNIGILTSANELSTQVIDDIISSRWFLVIALVAVIVLCLIYIFILRWFVCPLVWASITLLIALLIFSIYLCAGQYVYFRDNPIIMQNTNNIGSWIASLFQNADIWLTITIILSVLTAILLLVLIFLRKRINIAIELIKEGSKAVSSIRSTLAFPLLPWVFQMATIVYVVVILVFLMSMGTPKYAVIGLGGICGQYEEYGSCEPTQFNEDCNVLQCLNCTQVTCHLAGTENPPYTTALHAFNLFSFFWTLFFIQGMEGMILAATFATWYWTYNKKNLPFFTLTAGLWRSVWYHSGTVAFGALIIAIVRMIRVVLAYIERKVKKFDNPITKCILCLCQCFFACLENFLRFINKNAYIMCAVHGKAFCLSARDAFSLLMRNIVRVFVLDKVADFIFFLSKVLLGLGVGIGTYYLLQLEQLESWTGGERLHYYLVPSIILGASTYVIASIFFNVYSMAVDTLFLCFLEDSERNNGTAEKPYFMSKNLMKILGKRNKKFD